MTNNFILASKISEKLYEALIVDDRYMLYFKGLLNTLKMAALATIIGIVIGLLVAVIKSSQESNPFVKALSWILNLYTTIIRGTPVFLQILILYTAVFTSRNFSEVLIGGICFGINSGAYVSEIFRGAIASIDKGQMEAGRSLGFSHFQTMKSIIVPQAFKNAIPALGNEFVMLIKETSVASVIGVPELIRSAQNVGSKTWDILTPLYIVALIYLTLVIFIQKLQTKLEKRLTRQ